MVASSEIPWIPFDKAIEDSREQQRHLLLGNGFSIAAHDGFRYASLIDEACKRHEGLAEALLSLGADDFEEAMARAPDALTRDRIREAFIETICWIHPRRDEALPSWRRAYCADFLSHFLTTRAEAPRGKIFTTNYDLLLCWIIVEHLDNFACQDGFDIRQTWNPVRAPRSDYFYLHGALHLYEEKSKPYQLIRKHKAGAENTSPLPVLIRSFVSQGNFPLIVSEGAWADKAARIQRNDYLNPAIGELRAASERANSSMFILGHSLRAVDAHVINVIGSGDVEQVYVGVHDGGDIDSAMAFRDKWCAYRQRNDKRPLNLQLFRTAEANVWGPPA